MLRRDHGVRSAARLNPRIRTLVMGCAAATPDRDGRTRILEVHTRDVPLGDDVDRWPELVAEPGLHVHIYGKGDARPGRKMGHVTRLAD